MNHTPVAYIVFHIPYWLFTIAYEKRELEVAILLARCNHAIAYIYAHHLTVKYMHHIVHNLPAFSFKKDWSLEH